MNNKKHICEPPDTDSFHEIFDYFWDHGVGNQLQANGDPTPWTPETLETALDHAVTMRSIDSWHSREHLPKLKHVRMICRLIAPRNRELHKQWTEVFIKAWRLEERRRKKFKKQAETKPQGTLSLPQEKYTVILGALAIVAMIAFYAYQSTRFEPKVTKFIFCTVEQFSEQTKTCKASTTHFPAGTQKVMVSFKISNMFQGDVFERRWYRNGEKFMDRKDFYSPPWKGYTYIYNRHGHDQGEYTLRVVINDNVTARSFTIGEVK